ncbi:hypothetical protein GVN16_17815 [Emticicia sp. CRIBPO]|uniref:hypothetical protein n=1 Tax=Emticicia sp. CRIBPO TaxID=2683258 RepID=UPI0014137440|nr:hypothetical protein [Emticicia sp. CRIBPO]NBA87634.1 hypothetical protein [Emticicia sp. CRIBPO]
METSTKNRIQRWTIAICLLFILFFASQLPNPNVRKILVLLPGSIAVIIQLFILREKKRNSLKVQGIILLILTVLTMILSLYA